MVGFGKQGSCSVTSVSGAQKCPTSAEQLQLLQRDPPLPELHQEQQVCSERVDLRKGTPLCYSSWERGVRGERESSPEDTEVHEGGFNFLVVLSNLFC